MIDTIINAKLNKLLDAGGYSKTKNETILAEVVLAENPEAPGVTVYQGSDKLGLVVGKTYTVHLDSGSYKTVCKDFGGGLLLGNGAIVGSDSFASDESFAVGEMGEDGQSMCIIVDANNGKTASVSAITETIVPIDQKYLPYDWEGVRIPRVLCDEGYNPSEMEYLTVTDHPVAKTYEKLEYAVNNNLPILFNILIDFGDGAQIMGLLMHLQKSDRENQLFLASVGPLLLKLEKVWSGDQYSWEFSQVML